MGLLYSAPARTARDEKRQTNADVSLAFAAIDMPTYILNLDCMGIMIRI